MLKSQKAQAVLELAILGALIITAFSIWISYSEKYNREQSYMQQTFRAALKEAKNINNSASWDTIDFRRMPNVANPMELGELQQFSSSNNVLWSDGKKKGDSETEAKSYFQLNRGVPMDIPISEEPGPVSITTESISEYKSAPVSSVIFNKNEGGGSITTSKVLTATDTITGGMYVDGKKTSDYESSLGEGGIYKDEGGGLTRSRELK